MPCVQIQHAQVVTTQEAVDGSTPCRPLPPPLATLRSLAGSTFCGGPHHMCVGAGEEESLMSVRPTHRVGRFAVRSTHLDDLTLAPRGLGGSAFDDHVVAHLCAHGVTLTPATADCKSPGDSG